MFRREDFQIACRADVREAVEQNIEREPTAIALDKNIAHASVVATVVKQLQRAKRKLPSYYKARAIIPQLAYEQSSSEECAGHKKLRGQSLLDLTCGLGVDSFLLSQHFRRVVAVEQNELLADITRENYARLGVQNVEVICDTAEHFLECCTESFDCCLIDPDRRGAKGEKRVCLEHCSPNVIELLPAIKRVAQRCCIKCSPLFDVDEAFRIFGNCEVVTLSQGGEMKEVDIYLGEELQQITAMVIGKGEITSPLSERTYEWSEPLTDFSDYKYLIIPDVAVQHARMVSMLLKRWCRVWSDGGVAISKEEPHQTLGRIFRIEQVYPFGKTLKQWVQGRKLEIHRRDFPYTNAEICRSLGCKEGGEECWCFTRIGEGLYAIKMLKI